MVSVNGVPLRTGTRSTTKTSLATVLADKDIRRASIIGCDETRSPKVSANTEQPANFANFADVTSYFDQKIDVINSNIKIEGAEVRTSLKEYSDLLMSACTEISELRAKCSTYEAKIRTLESENDAIKQGLEEVETKLSEVSTSAQNAVTECLKIAESINNEAKSYAAIAAASNDRKQRVASQNMHQATAQSAASYQNSSFDVNAYDSSGYFVSSSLLVFGQKVSNSVERAQLCEKIGTTTGILPQDITECTPIGKPNGEGIQVLKLGFQNSKVAFKVLKKRRTIKEVNQISIAENLSKTERATKKERSTLFQELNANPTKFVQWRGCNIYMTDAVETPFAPGTKLDWIMYDTEKIK